VTFSRLSVLIGAAWLAAALSPLLQAQAPAARADVSAPVRSSGSSASAQASADQSDPAAVLSKYCVTCHNERLKTGGLVIDPAQFATIGDHADAWEKVAKKLRTSAMPPAGAPRPDAATYDAVATSIESALDRASAARPQVGKLPIAHRLSRTEYRNAVRDLLALGDLPKEVSVDYLLPADNISSGFDTIADLLFVSPSAMERYLDAAQKISRLAIGDTTMPVLVNIHPLDPEHPQDERVDDLPFGTRGGLAVRSDFPVDGTYTVKVELAGGGRDAHQLEITVDGERVRLEALGGAPGGRGGRGGRGGGAPDPRLEFPLSIKAGTRLVGVAFVQRTEARDEATLRPRTRSRGTQPAIASVTISGPYGASTPGDSASRRRIFVCRPSSAADEVPCATKILSSLARRAYRRPVTDVDLRDLMPFFQQGRAAGSFDLGIQKALERMLVSSQFLFRIERPVPGGSKDAQLRGRGSADPPVYPISDLELASRLSFFLWSSIPDDELLDAAIAGRLKQPAVLERQVRRMLADERSSALVTNFAAQWLYLRDIEAKLPDEVLFQDFDETLRAAMERETELFIDSIFRENRSVVDLLSADYTFLNERLAKHYGIPNVRGSYFRRVALPAGSPRGGLLGHGSVLTITSYSTRTSPVLRGKWVLENLLSAAPPPPPADIPALETKGAAPGELLTMREAMTRHRASPACASCHARMDPIGFAMEQFDAVGRWRDNDGGQAIDVTGVFPDGVKFEGIAGLKRELLRHPEQFASTVAERLLMYAVGRNLQYYDAPAVRAILKDARPARYTLSSLVLGVVKSRPFQMREAS
jgi:mono/diheme cytochrome c family protein